MNKLILKTATTINAPIAEVWDALVNPVQIKKYFFGTEMKSDLKVGSPITFSGVWDGTPYEDKGTILEKFEGRKLKYNYWSSFSGTTDEPANYANITYELEEKNGQTIYTLTQDGLKDEAAVEQSRKNWEAIFKGMKELLEEKD